MNSRYETSALLDQYLLFHYGNEQDQLPFAFGPHEALNFPVRCVTECINLDEMAHDALGLDLGCAVGRSTFELSKYCQRVIGIDKSQSFIRAAKHLQDHGHIEYFLPEEGSQIVQRSAFLPKDTDTKKVEFHCKDAMDCFNSISHIFHVVLAANLICRLPDPKSFLEEIHHLVAPLGQLIITSPYSWLEEFTPRSHWLENENGESGLDSLKKTLNKHFDLKRAFDMPFLLREHKRKYQYGVAQASIWIKSR